MIHMEITFIFVYMNYVIISQHTLVHCKVDSNMTISSCHISALKIIFDVERKTNKSVFIWKWSMCICERCQYMDYGNYRRLSALATTVKSITRFILTCLLRLKCELWLSGGPQNIPKTNVRGSTAIIHDCLNYCNSSLVSELTKPQ